MSARSSAVLQNEKFTCKVEVLMNANMKAN